MLVNGPSDVPQGAPPDAPREDERKHHDAVLQWAEQALNEGEAFLKSQVGYNDFDTTVSMIMGDDKSGDARPSILSSLSTNQFGKIALDLKIRRARHQAILRLQDLQPALRAAVRDGPETRESLVDAPSHPDADERRTILRERDGHRAYPSLLGHPDRRPEHLG
jgi:hypothetical protein